MIKKTITYTDYNGLPHTEDFYFNLNRVELLQIDAEYPEGFAEKIKHVMDSNDKKAMIDIFADLILRSLGHKSADGTRFVKSKEYTDSFFQSPAYEELFMEIGFDADKAADFVNGLIPPNLIQNASNN